MKRLLTILGSISLLALSGSSVVSCAIKVKAKPNFSGIADINEGSWKTLSKRFTDKEIDLESNLDQPIVKDSYLYRSIRNDFNNPEKIDDYFDKYDVKYAVQNRNEVYKDGEQKEIDHWDAIIWLKVFDKSGETNKNKIPRNDLTITVYPELESGKAGKKRLTTATYPQREIAPKEKKVFESIYVELVSIANLIQRSGLSAVPEPQVADALMGDFDVFFKNLLIQEIAKECLPFADDETFNETIGQQFKYLDKDYRLLNDVLFKQLYDIVQTKKNISDNNMRVNKNDIEDKITRIQLGDLTLVKEAQASGTK